MDPHQRGIAQLVTQAGGGDGRALQELWSTHRRWVAAIVLAHRPRSVEVDDLMQDVALKLVDKLSTLRDPHAFRPWLRQIIINICRGAGRSAKASRSINSSTVNGAVDGMAWDPIAPEQPRDDEAADRDLAEHLLQQVMGLPAEYREPLLLRSMGSMNYQQISQTLDLPVTTVETRLARARRMLREEYQLQQWGTTP